MSDHMPTDAQRCAWCDRPLPDPDDVMVIVRPSDGATTPTCSAACLAALLRRREPTRRTLSTS